MGVLNMKILCTCLIFLMIHQLSSVSSFSAKDYADALGKCIMFYEAQRSGKLPPDQRVTWRENSALYDGFTEHVNLVGGYYDAGDNIKFGLPMAFTITLLSWSVIEFGNSSNGQLRYSKEAIRWGTDYLLKAAVNIDQGILYVQVGEPTIEHNCWERPEDMDSKQRSVYKVTAQTPGSDVAGETAAALAAASIVFKRSDDKYSNTLLDTAIKVFHFANTYRGAYSDFLSSEVCPYYCSYSKYGDELLWGAAWLFKASGETTYIDFIRSSDGASLDQTGDKYSFSWDDKKPGTNFLLAKGFFNKNDNKAAAKYQQYKLEADDYLCNLLTKSQYTTGGLYHKYDSSPLQYVTTSSFLVLTYAKYLGAEGSLSCGGISYTAETLISHARKQVDYILGDNPADISYMVGFGQRYPQHVHHRGSSIPSMKQQHVNLGCNGGSQYLNSPSPNPNVLVGAVVGGPDSQDNYADDRNNYAQSEPATYINAPLVGALAFFSG